MLLYFIDVALKILYQRHQIDERRVRGESEMIEKVA
jgi:hypothetical protein